MYKTGLGQAGHRFLPEDSSKPCVIGGIIFEDTPGLDAESDGDVVFHAICQAISSLSGVPILGTIARDLCRKDGITDSQVYVEKALKTLANQKLLHVALSIEGTRPELEEKIEPMRRKVASILQLPISAVGITAALCDGLTDFSCGEGLQCLCIITSINV